jgi:hypothetical protein
LHVTAGAQIDSSQLLPSPFDSAGGAVSMPHASMQQERPATAAGAPSSAGPSATAGAQAPLHSVLHSPLPSSLPANIARMTSIQPSGLAGISACMDRPECGSRKMQQGPDVQQNTAGRHAVSRGRLTRLAWFWPLCAGAGGQDIPPTLPSLPLLNSGEVEHFLNLQRRLYSEVWLNP